MCPLSGDLFQVLNDSYVSSRDIQKTGLVASSQRWKLRFRNLGRIVRIFSSSFSEAPRKPLIFRGSSSLEWLR